MELELYNYQNDAIKFVLDNIDISDVLLAAAPNAGKTIMTAYVIQHFVQNNKRVLCSVHGTNVLKRQFYDSICDIVGYDKVSIYDITDISLYNPGKLVQIMIYQNKKQMEECVDKYGIFDYLVVDEAHKFYENTDSMNIIVNNFVNGNHLLLTGSPAIFKDKVNEGSLAAKYISASLIESTQPGQYDKEILLDVVMNDVSLSVDDYNTIGEVCKKSEKKLINNALVLDAVLVGDFGKTIIYVKRQQQANDIKTYLKSRHIKTYISHSGNDKDSSNIKRFRENYTGIDNVVLIVVNRATEGFDDPNVSIIDMTYSKNIDLLYQLYSRAIRKRTNAIHKRYIKVIPNNGNSAEVNTHIMTAVLMLLRQENYVNFNGKNFSVPTFKPDAIRKPKSGVGYVKSYYTKKVIETNDINDNNIVIKSSENLVSVRDLVCNANFTIKIMKDDISYIIHEETFDNWQDSLSGEYKIIIEKITDTIDEDLLLETSLFSGIFFDIKDESYGHITRYATNKLSDVLREINVIDYFTDIEGYFALFRKENITNSIIWGDIYKTLCNRDDKKYHSSPWNLFYQTEKEFFEKCYNKQKYYDDKDGYFKLIRDEKISSGHAWTKKYKSLIERDGLRYHSNPWRDLYKQSPKNFFDECYPNKQDYYNNKEGYMKLIQNESITGSVCWNKIFQKLSKRDNVKYHSNPWHLFNMSQKDFFNECYPNRQDYYNDKEGYFELIKKNKITSNGIWCKNYKRLGIENGLKYRSEPWIFFNQTSKDFFEECFDKQDFYNDKEGYFKLLKKENIKGNNVWSGNYKRLSKRDGVRYRSNPWFLFNQSVKEFFGECYPEKKFFDDKEGYFKLIRANDITSNTSWNKIYKILSEHDDMIYHSTPWNLYNQSVKEFFEECYPNKQKHFDNKEGYFKLIRRHEITGYTGWKRMYKRLCKQDALKYYANPWDNFKQTSKEFFAEYREWLENNPKKEREYQPVYLGEFSEMNKTWNISNSKTTHTRLKEDISEWVNYHKLYSDARKNWGEIPYKVIANKIKARPEWIVADFGCGENLLSKEINNQVYAFDHIAIDDAVISCDISQTPLANESIDVAVLSLALMGSNHLDYIKEAYRTLKHMGILLISEPSNRWMDKIDEFQQSIEDIGFTFSIEYSDKFIYITSIKK